MPNNENVAINWIVFFFLFTILIVLCSTFIEKKKKERMRDDTFQSGYIPFYNTHTHSNKNVHLQGGNLLLLWFCIADGCNCGEILKAFKKEYLICYRKRKNLNELKNAFNDFSWLQLCIKIVSCQYLENSIDAPTSKPLLLCHLSQILFSWVHTSNIKVMLKRIFHDSRTHIKVSVVPILCFHSFIIGFSCVPQTHTYGTQKKPPELYYSIVYCPFHLFIADIHVSLFFHTKATPSRWLHRHK